ncbi:MAG: peptide deformylase, partial [Mycobacteriales bacterium]
VLSTPAVPVDPARLAEAAALAAAMVELMRAAPSCVGVAAPQVGRGVRLFVLDVTGHRLARSCHGLVQLANPTVVSKSGAEVAREGCLSVPDLTGDVSRATQVVVAGLDLLTGGVRVVDADAFEARALQHELDHLDGLVFLDRVTHASGIHRRKRYGVR